jgi:hypothetical protein
VRALLPEMAIQREKRWDEPFGQDGHRVLILADKR